MARLALLDEHTAFPPTSAALDDPNGLLAVGGTLTAERLISAYRRGIFPWYSPPQPVLWWSPDPRSIRFPAHLHVSRSLRRTLRRDRFRLSVDRAFERVMRACAQPRRGAPGTWIDEAMIAAYSDLQRLGLAHSIEVMDPAGKLVGGLYGVALGRVFFGESMFSRQTDASKTALVALVQLLRRADCHMIDCQVESAHMNAMGAHCIDRLDFEQRLAQTVDEEPNPDMWRLPETCGELL